MSINSTMNKYNVIYCIYKMEHYTKMRKLNRASLLLLEVRMAVILVVIMTGRSMRGILGMANLFFLVMNADSGVFALG